ncbi:MAG: hypothetical protein HAW60_02060 [Bdellovibrionales bacterium]|nr:hypothetical protein [Bdellovibrionales bacterium]
MFKSVVFFLILVFFLPAKSEQNLNLLNLPEGMKESALKIIKDKQLHQKKFLEFVKNKALQGNSSLELEFPFYHVNTKLKNSNWHSLPKSQIYFLALKDARHKVSQVLFNIVLEDNKIKSLKRRLQFIIDKKTKYYIFSEKVFKFNINSKFSFISTASVRLKISFINLKKILDKEGLLHIIKDKFNILPMFNILNTKTGYAKNWWQKSNVSLYSSAIDIESKNQIDKKSLSIITEDKNNSVLNKQTSLDRTIDDLKLQFLKYFANQAKPLSLYLFNPTKFNFQKFIPKDLLKKSSFYPIKIASYLEPDLILNAEISYSLDEQKQILKMTLMLKIFKTSNKKTVVVFNKKRQWSIGPETSTTTPVQISKKIKKQILEFFKESGDLVLKDLVGIKSKALLQAYEVTLIVKGALYPSDLYKFISIFKFHMREVLDVQVQTLSRSEFHLKLSSTLKPQDIIKKIKNLSLPSYEISSVSLFNNSKISFFLKKLKNKK